MNQQEIIDFLTKENQVVMKRPNYNHSVLCGRFTNTATTNSKQKILDPVESRRFCKV